MREGMWSSRDEQHSIEQGYSRLLLKMLKDIASRRASRMAIRRCLAGWRGGCVDKNSEVRAQVRKAFHCLCRSTTRRMQAVILEWSWCVGQRRHTEKRASIFLRKVVGCRCDAPVEIRLLSSTRCLFAHLSAWRRHTTVQRMDRTPPPRVARFLARGKMRWVAAALAAWHTNAATARRLRVAARRVVTAMLMRGLVAALQRWTEVVQEVRQTRAQLRKTAARAFSSLVSARNRAFEQWHTNVATERRMRIAAGRVVTAMLMRGLVAALQRWAEVVQTGWLERIQLRKTAARAFASLLSVRNPTPSTLNPKPKTQNPKPKTLNLKP